MNIDIDIAIFISFLALNLIIGIGYGANVKDIKEYALGGRNFSTAALVSTIVATWATGSSFFVILSKTYASGMGFAIAVCCLPLSLLIMASFFIPKMEEFMGSLSIGEVMGKIYGNEARMITAICGILACVGSIAVQFKVFGSIFNYFLGISEYNAIIIASVIVILYSTFGGIKAVTYTDVIQFFTFGFVIPLIGIIIWNEFNIQGLSLKNAVNHPLFDYQKIFSTDNPNIVSLIFLMLYFTIPNMSPTAFQRISMGQNIKQVRKAFFISTILLSLVLLAIIWIPFLILNIKTDLQPHQVTSFIIENYTYTGLKGLIIIGVSAMAMSSADSFINNCAVLFGYDLKEVFNIKVNHLILSKVFSLFLGVFAIYLAISTNDLLSMVMFSASFYMASVAIPILLAILGFRTTKKSVLIAMSAGFTTVIVWKIFQISYDVIIPAMIINTISLFGSHYFLKQKGGWIKIPSTQLINENKINKITQLTKFIRLLKFSNFIKFCKKTAPKNEIIYTWLGIYFIFFTFSTIYSTQIALSKENSNFILAIYQIMMCTGTLVAMYPIWPPRIKHEIIMQVSWNIVIFFMLVFFSCFFVMLNGFGQLQFAIFTMNLMITALLVGWKMSLGMIIVGFYLSAQFYKYYAGIDTLDLSFGSPQFIFMYSLMLVGSALVIFLRPQQELQELTEEKNEHLSERIYNQAKLLREALGLRAEFIRNVTHEYHAPMAGITTMAQTLLDSYDKLTDEQRKIATEIILKSSSRLESFDASIASLSKLKGDGYILNKEGIDLSSLVSERLAFCRKLYEENKEDREFILDVSQSINLNGDKYYLTQVLDNLIINAISYCKKGKIKLSLKHTEDQIIFTINDEGIGIPSEELEAIFDEFTVSSKTRSNAGGRGVGLALCKRVIEVHGGKISAECDDVEGTTFKLSFPIHT